MRALRAASIAIGLGVVGAAPSAVADGARVSDGEEPTKARSGLAAQGDDASAGFRPVADFTLPLVRWYRREVGPQSVSRCPFATSCSCFAARAVRAEGMLGWVRFLDRFLYRENVATMGDYDRVVAADGTLRADDDLDGESEECDP